MLARSVGVKEFQRLLQEHDGILLDVRSPAEFSGGYIPGALNNNIHGSGFDAFVDTLDKNRPVFLYCASGGRSKRAMKALKDKGFTHIYELDDGIGAWHAAGYAMQR